MVMFMVLVPGSTPCMAAIVPHLDVFQHVVAQHQGRQVGLREIPATSSSPEGVLVEMTQQPSEGSFLLSSDQSMTKIWQIFVSGPESS